MLFTKQTDSIFGTSFSGVTGTLKSLWNGAQRIDNTHAQLIDLVHTGYNGIDNRVVSTASYLKQMTAGTMSEMTFGTYHKICSANIGRASRFRKPPETFLFKFILMTPCQNFTYSITDVESMWKNPVFDPQKKTVVFVTGWLMTLNDAIAPIVHTVSKAYLCRGDVNFIVSV